MGVVLSIAAAMIVWVVSWALGWRNVDGGFAFLLIIFLGGTASMVFKLLPGNQDQSASNPDAAPFN